MMLSHTYAAVSSSAAGFVLRFAHAPVTALPILAADIGLRQGMSVPIYQVTADAVIEPPIGAYVYANLSVSASHSPSVSGPALVLSLSTPLADLGSTVDGLFTPAFAWAVPVLDAGLLLPWLTNAPVQALSSTYASAPLLISNSEPVYSLAVPPVHRLTQEMPCTVDVFLVVTRLEPMRLVVEYADAVADDPAPECGCDTGNVVEAEAVEDDDISDTGSDSDVGPLIVTASALVPITAAMDLNDTSAYYTCLCTATALPWNRTRAPPAASAHLYPAPGHPLYDASAPDTLTPLASVNISFPLVTRAPMKATRVTLTFTLPDKAELPATAGLLSGAAVATALRVLVEAFMASAVGLGLDDFHDISQTMVESAAEAQTEVYSSNNTVTLLLSASTTSFPVSAVPPAAPGVRALLLSIGYDAALSAVETLLEADCAESCGGACGGCLDGGRCADGDDCLSLRCGEGVWVGGGGDGGMFCSVHVVEGATWS
jgi:hypothetical protein